MSEIPYGKSEMQTAEAYAQEVRSWIADAADQRHGRRKRVLADIAREAGLHVRRVAAHFYGEVRSPSAAEYDQLKRWRRYEMMRRLEHHDREMAALRVRLQEMQNDGP